MPRLCIPVCGLCAGVRVFVCVRACVPVHFRVFVCVRARACVRARMRALVCACVHACVGALGSCVPESCVPELVLSTCFVSFWSISIMQRPAL